MTTRGAEGTIKYAKWIMRWTQQRVKAAGAPCAAAHVAVRRGLKRWRTSMRDVCCDLGWTPGPLVHHLLERAHTRLASADEKRRIEKELAEYGRSGAAGIDLLRAAALWAGAGSERYALRK